MSYPDSRNIVIIGGVAGGASAAARARRINETANIILLEKAEHVSFANCGLPSSIGGEITQRDKLLVAKPEKFNDFFNIDVRTFNEATAIDRDRQIVSVCNHQTGEQYELPYDRLILAPGAEPIRPPINGIDAQNVFTLRNVADSDQVNQYIEQHKPQRAVVVGGGYIGLEMVEQLQRRGMTVALSEMIDQVMGPLDPEMAHIAEQELVHRGVETHIGNGLSDMVVVDGMVRQVVLQDGTKLQADMVVLGLGVKPKTELAQVAGLEIGDSGGIAVNQYMQTSDPLIYAVGDAVEYEHQVLGRKMRIPLAGPANRAGRIAGEHAAADASPAMAPVLGTSIVRVFEKTAAMTGLSEKMAARAGLEVHAVWVPAAHHVGYYPGAEPMMLKLIYDNESGKVLGAQAVGGEGVDKRIDVIATVIMLGGTVDQLTELDLCYAPPYGAAKDPVHMAGFVAQNEMRGMENQQPPRSYDPDDAQTQWLDVRFEPEWNAGHLPTATWIPLPQLRQRLDELDRNRPVVTICKGGQRSYYAGRILRQSGFAEVATLSGGMTMQPHVKSALVK